MKFRITLLAAVPLISLWDKKKNFIDIKRTESILKSNLRSYLRTFQICLYFERSIDNSLQNITNENVAFCLFRLRGQNSGQKLGRPVSEVLFHSKAVEMTTAEHYKYLMKFFEFLTRQCYCTVLEDWNLFLEPTLLLF